MEVEWISNRVQLRNIMLKYPDSSIRDIHRRVSSEVNCCPEWTRKWYHRLKDCDPDDATVLMSLSRRHKYPVGAKNLKHGYFEGSSGSIVVMNNPIKLITT
jgi:hypothetical protein